MFSRAWVQCGSGQQRVLESLIQLKPSHCWLKEATQEISEYSILQPLLGELDNL